MSHYYGRCPRCLADDQWKEIHHISKKIGADCVENEVDIVCDGVLECADGDKIACGLTRTVVYDTFKEYEKDV